MDCDEQQFQGAYNGGSEMKDCCSPLSLKASAWLWELVRDFPVIAPVHNRRRSLCHLIVCSLVNISYPRMMWLLRELWFPILMKSESVVGNWLSDLLEAFWHRAITMGIWTCGCTLVLGSFSLTCIFVLCNRPCCGLRLWPCVASQASATEL